MSKLSTHNSLPVLMNWVQYQNMLDYYRNNCQSDRFELLRGLWAGKKGIAARQTETVSKNYSHPKPNNRNRFFNKIKDLKEKYRGVGQVSLQINCAKMKHCLRLEHLY